MRSMTAWRPMVPVANQPGSKQVSTLSSESTPPSARVTTQASAPAAVPAEPTRVSDVIATVVTDVLSPLPRTNPSPPAHSPPHPTPPTLHADNPSSVGGFNRPHPDRPLSRSFFKSHHSRRGCPRADGRHHPRQHRRPVFARLTPDIHRLE